jgi:radical SAM family uncharacterized protein/radical SAM-linked protein
MIPLEKIERIKKFEIENLPFVEKPSRYIGIELQEYLKKDIFMSNQKIRVKICLVFPDLYEIGMSYLGIKLLFHYLNRFEDILVDIAFMPKKDFADKLKENNVDFYSLGYKIPLKEFDFVGFSLNYELCYSNVLSILHYSNIPLHAEARAKSSENFPIILAGGCATSNPLPMSKFIDAFVIGDGEEVLLEILGLVKAEKFDFDRDDVLKNMTELDGVYVPLKTAKSKKIKPRFVKDLDKNYFPTKVISPFVNTVHDHLSIEIQRGCYRGCKFCHASFINRPVRTRSFESIKNLIQKSIEESGLTEISLLSLSVIDHPEIEAILKWFVENYYDKHYSISLPSLRCDRFSLDLAEMVSKNKKSSLTFAPEAGSQRLRDVIGKNVTEEDIFACVGDAHKKGWKLVKLYFMYGLPTETMEDIEAIVDLVKRLRNKYKSLKLNIGISSFVPKAHTPFAWAKQENLESLLLKKKFIIENLKKFAQVKHSRLEGSIVEGLFARGDARASDIIERAWQNGAMFDQWEEFFNYEIWKKAGEDFGIDLENYVCRDMNVDDCNAWEVIDFGIEKDVLFRMGNKVVVNNGETREIVDEEDREGTLPSPLFGKERGQDRDREREGEEKNSTLALLLNKEEGTGIGKVDRYRVRYGKGFDIRFVSHLETVEVIKNLIVRSNLPIVFSDGFHPLPRISCNIPLSVGFVAENEWFDFELYENLDTEYVKNILEKSAPFGIEIKEIRKIQFNSLSLDKILKMVEYEIILPDSSVFVWDKNILKEFLNKNEFVVGEMFKKNTEKIDLVKIVYDLKIIDEKKLNIILNINEHLVGPYRVLEKIFGIDEILFKKSIVTRKRFWLGNGIGAVVKP